MPLSKTDLYLMRHAKAEPGLNMDDSERALTEEGRAQVVQAGKALLFAQWPLPKKIITSPYKRAVETAEIIGEELGIIDIKTIGYDEITNWTLLRVYVADEPILFVGHEPYLSSFISHLTGKDVSVKKSSIHRISYDAIEDRGEYMESL